MEEPRWHTIIFKHRCGFQGKIREISVTKSLMLSVSGYCERCGIEFELQELLTSFIDRLSEIENKKTENKLLDLADIPESYFDGKIH